MRRCPDLLENVLIMPRTFYLRIRSKLLLIYTKFAVRGLQVWWELREKAAVVYTLRLNTSGRGASLLYAQLHYPNHGRGIASTSLHDLRRRA